VAEIVSAGGIARFVAVDVSDSASVRDMVDRTEWFGRLDCPFNNAAIEESAPLADCDEAVWNRTIDVNLKGVFLCMKYEIPVMQEQSGWIDREYVLGERIANPERHRSLHGQKVRNHRPDPHGRGGIRRRRRPCECDLPGAIVTPMMEKAIADYPSRLERIKHTRPLGRAADPIVIANACLWLCSDQTAHVTAHSLPVDGGHIGAA